MTHDTKHAQACPSCGVHYFYAGFECADGLVRGRLRCHCHQPSQRWFTDAARAWRATDSRLVGTDWVRA
jgi:hypothetical protein